MEKEEEAHHGELVNSKINDLIMNIEEKGELVKGNRKMELTVDEVIEGYVGSMGFSQLVHVLLVSMAWMFDSQNTLVTIFTDAQPSSSTTSLSSSSVECRGMMESGSWEWVGGSRSTTIAQWGLVCHRKYLAAIPASLFFLGSLLGSAVYGRLADSVLGRKKSMLLSCLLTSATAFLTSLSPNIWTYAFLRFANGFARSGIGICCLVLSTESVGHKWRGQVGQYGFFFFTAGFLSLPLIAYPTRTCWQNLYKIISLPPLLYSLFIIPFVSESPHWLLVRGRSKEALDILTRFAKLNGRKLPSNLVLSEPSPAKVHGQALPMSDTGMNLWTTRWAMKRMVRVMMAGFGIGFVYYGIQLNVENLNFNLYFTVALNAMMEIPAVFIGSVLLSFTNRRLLLSQSAYIAGASCILCILFSYGRTGHGKANESSKGSWLQLSIEAVGFMAASTAFDVLYIYCVELFPTNVRNLAVSMLRQALMLGASIAPLLVAVGRFSPPLSFLVFGVLSIFSGMLSLWLPETRNAPLYETLEQQEEEERLNSASQESGASGLELG